MITPPNVVATGLDRQLAGQLSVLRAPHRFTMPWPHLNIRDACVRSLLKIDRLHQAAGSLSVIDLHGRLDQVCCLACSASEHRDSVQRRLLVANPHLEAKTVLVKPDGDADISDELVSMTKPPECLVCGGVLMPDVVFFGGSVPKQRVQQCLESIDASDGLMVIGSSLQVYSGYRFVKYA